MLAPALTAHTDLTATSPWSGHRPVRQPRPGDALTQPCLPLPRSVRPGRQPQRRSPFITEAGMRGLRELAKHVHRHAASSRVRVQRADHARRADPRRSRHARTGAAADEQAVPLVGYAA